jgi:nitroimidazol reductase NimA-like FMN-containing flavoprotein (pyridoxamine 5'-phosphate oxidase superfamily)
MSKEAFQPTARTTLKRRPNRGVYDRAVVNAILDDGFMCMVAYVHEHTPMVLPTGYGRMGNYIYIHGSNASTMLGAALKDQEVCVNVTHIDGLVLARSLYNHSVNYRSVVIIGRAELVEDRDEKVASFQAYANQVLKGRFEDVRGPNEKELNSTTVMRISLQEVVCKLRTGPGADFDGDLDNDCWAGELLIKQVMHKLVRDPRGRQDVPAPDYITSYEHLPGKGAHKIETTVDVL